jgi:HPt (histidine-containing phosphotransfer) domain-containing protein
MDRKKGILMDNEVLDLEEFWERVQDDKKLLLELLDIFVRDFKEKRTQMAEAIRNKDIDQIKRIAHALKGSSGNISAKLLRLAVVQLENMGKNNNLNGADEALSDMDRKFEELTGRIAVLKQELS